MVANISPPYPALTVYSKSPHVSADAERLVALTNALCGKAAAEPNMTHTDIINESILLLFIKHPPLLLKSLPVFFTVDPEADRTFEVFKIRFITAHSLARSVREFGNWSAVYILQFDNNIKCIFAGIV